MEEQVCVICAGINGYLDPLPLDKVRAFEDGLLSLLRGKNAEILKTIRDSRDLADDRREAEGGGREFRQDVRLIHDALACRVWPRSTERHSGRGRA